MAQKTLAVLSHPSLSLQIEICTFLDRKQPLHCFVFSGVGVSPSVFSLLERRTPVNIVWDVDVFFLWSNNMTQLISAHAHTADTRCRCHYHRYWSVRWSAEAPLVLSKSPNVAASQTNRSTVSVTIRVDASGRRNVNHSYHSGNQRRTIADIYRVPMGSWPGHPQIADTSHKTFLKKFHKLFFWKSWNILGK